MYEATVCMTCGEERDGPKSQEAHYRQTGHARFRYRLENGALSFERIVKGAQTTVEADRRRAAAERPVHDPAPTWNLRCQECGYVARTDRAGEIHERFSGHSAWT